MKKMKNISPDKLAKASRAFDEFSSYKQDFSGVQQVLKKYNLTKGEVRKGIEQAKGNWVGQLAVSVLGENKISEALGWIDKNITQGAGTTFDVDSSTPIVKEDWSNKYPKLR